MQNIYRMIGWINHPDLMPYPTEESIADFKKCQQQDDTAFELLKNKYNLGESLGNRESFDSEEPYIIDEDADGVYLFEKIS